MDGKERDKRYRLTAIQPTTSRQPWSLARSMVAAAMSYVDLCTGEPRVEHGVSGMGCQMMVEKGMGCDRGVGDYDMRNLRDRVYSHDGYHLKHFRWCRKAQRLWESRNSGTVPANVRNAAV